MADHKTTAQAMFDAMGSGNDVDAAIDAYIAEDFVEHEDIPGLDNTREAPRQMFKMMHAAFPDFRINVKDLIQDGDTVAARVTMAGTHEGEFMGVPASGNAIEINAIEILEFRGDKCIAHWGVMDMAGMMAQMGAAGAPG
jgi:steroid delta-isomerase-like uncharacterized protein